MYICIHACMYIYIYRERERDDYNIYIYIYVFQNITLARESRLGGPPSSAPAPAPDPWF